MGQVLDFIICRKRKIDQIDSNSQSICNTNKQIQSNPYKRRKLILPTLNHNKTKTKNRNININLHNHSNTHSKKCNKSTKIKSLIPTNICHSDIGAFHKIQKAKRKQSHQYWRNQLLSNDKYYDDKRKNTQKQKLNNQKPSNHRKRVQFKGKRSKNFYRDRKVRTSILHSSLNEKDNMSVLMSYCIRKCIETCGYYLTTSPKAMEILKEE
eukprot:207950_1